MTGAADRGGAGDGRCRAERGGRGGGGAGGRGGSGYKVSGGLHGVGVSAVNAVSEWCEVEVKRNGQIHFQRYVRGAPVKPVEVIGKVPKTETGTKTTFKFDSEIFKGEMDYRFE